MVVTHQLPRGSAMAAAQPRPAGEFRTLTLEGANASR
jgi:hypothetical protein